MSHRVAQSKQKGGAQSDYQTPRWCIDRLLELRLPAIFDADVILEPNAGEGRIADALRDHGSTAEIHAFEIQPRYEAWLKESAADVVRIGDCFTLIDDYPGGGTLITNPAFPISMRILRAYELLVDHVIFLQKISFISSSKRHAWMSTHMPDVYGIPDRPSFTKDGGTDQAFYVWLHWDTRNPRAKSTFEMLAATHANDRNRR